MIADDRYLAWYAQQQLQLVSTSHVVKFGTEFVLPSSLDVQDKRTFTLGGEEGVPICWL